MVCTPATGYGSGCDEGELLLSFIFFGVSFLLLAAFALALTRGYRHNLPLSRKWLPFTLYCAIALVTVASTAIGTGMAP